MVNASWQRGNVVFMGDARHGNEAMRTPGVALAIEQGWLRGGKPREGGLINLDIDSLGN
jgi:hypothetical protein